MKKMMLGLIAVVCLMGCSNKYNSFVEHPEQEGVWKRYIKESRSNSNSTKITITYFLDENTVLYNREYNDTRLIPDTTWELLIKNEDYETE